MTATIKSLETASQQVGATDTTLYTVPGATTTKIESFILTNASTTVSYVVSVHKVKSGDAVGDDTKIINALSIPPKGSVELIQRPWLMATGDFLSAIADVAAHVTVHISGIEVT
jgi:hypothetical protein